MTAQVGDSMLFGGKVRMIVGALPIDPRTVAPGGGLFLFGTSCRRGYVATWEVRASRVYLKQIDGAYRLASKEPVEAVWLNGIVRIADGPMVRYVHAGYASEYAAVQELDVVAGTIRRQRRLEVPDSAELRRGISQSSPGWEYLPEAAELLPPECRASTRDGIPDPMEGEPSLAGFSGQHLRERIMAERNARRLRYGDLMRLAGYASAKGAALAEWERGQRAIPPDMEEALCAALGVTASALDECRQRDRDGHRAAWDAWADEAVMPTLKVAHGAPVRYAAPSRIRGDPDALLRWASDCVKIIWRPADLVLSRRRVIRFNSLGDPPAGSIQSPEDLPSLTPVH